MWKNLKKISCIKTPKIYGETIFRLSQAAHKIPFENISDTIILSSDCFKSYIQDRCIDPALIIDCVNQLKSINIEENMDITVSISVYKVCNINSDSITTKANYIGIKNAITSIYERWFDGKPYSYRIAHKMPKEDTYPSIYIQPCFQTELYSMITRQPSSGELMSNVTLWNLVHCTCPLQGENERNLVSAIDTIFPLPQKIYFYYDQSSKDIIITSLGNYPMTKNAYIGCLIEKHRNKLIDDKCLIEHINESDIIKFEGYTLSSQHIYKGFGISPGYANGKAIFYFSDFKKLLQDDDSDYIFFGIESSYEDIDILKKCKGAIFTRGGMTSHAGVICRGLRVPAISYSKIKFDKVNNMVITDAETIKEGDEICISSHENCWSKNGRFENLYKPHLNDHPLLYILDIMKRFRNEASFSCCSIDFQCHFATIIRALKKAGYDI